MVKRRLLELAPRAARPARLLALALAAWSVFACVYVMFGRLFYPFELEWMSGSILDHVERVQHHEAVYAAPTASWIPFLYPPLYYWAAAALARSVPLVVACRGISIASTFVQAGCVWRLAQRAGATRFWCAIGVGAFFAAYQIADYWYDIERPDSLFMAMVLVGAVVLGEVRGVVGAAVSGLVMGFAFFAKQPAAMFVGGAAVGLALRKEWARVAAFVIAAGVAIVPLYVSLDAETHGWFSYYVTKMPRSHGVTSSLVPQLVYGDLPHAWAWTLATAVLIGGFVRRRLGPREDTMFVCLLGAALAASVASRLHIGGWANVLSFWTAFGSAGIAVFGTRAEAAIASAAAAEPGGRWTEAARSATALPALLAAAQLLGCTYAPADHIPRRATVGQFQSFVDRVRSLEERGEVIYVGRGHVTKARHFHMAALIDVVTVEHALPEDVAKAFREQRFAAVVIDSFDDLWIPLHPEIKGELFQVVCANYYVAEKLDERIPFPVLGWPARPTWLLLPRGERLDETDRALLERRSMIELQIATMREEATIRRGTVFPEHRDTMETVGKQVYDRVFAGSVERPDAAPPP